jgi:polyphosphate kinase
MSSRIRVRSIVGKYLEHSRIYRFGEGERARHYIGSADVMGRNLDRRYEALVSVTAPELRARLDAILDAYLEDDRLAWRLEGDGTWRQAVGERGVAVQEVLEARASSGGRGDFQAKAPGVSAVEAGRS